MARTESASYWPVIRLILAVLACYRLGTLVAEDDGPADVFRNLRKWSDGKRKNEQAQWRSKQGNRIEMGPYGEMKPIPPRGKWANIDDGLNCPFCVGVWAALLLAILVYTGIGDFVLLWLGIAGGQSLLQDLRKE